MHREKRPLIGERKNLMFLKVKSNKGRREPSQKAQQRSHGNRQSPYVFFLPGNIFSQLLSSASPPGKKILSIKIKTLVSFVLINSRNGNEASFFFETNKLSLVKNYPLDLCLLCLLFLFLFYSITAKAFFLYCQSLKIFMIHEGSFGHLPPFFKEK